MKFSIYLPFFHNGLGVQENLHKYGLVDSFFFFILAVCVRLGWFVLTKEDEKELAICFQKFQEKAEIPFR